MAAAKRSTNEVTEAPVEPEVIEAPAYIRLRSPQGSETTVPAAILDALLDSGYVRVG